MSDNIKITRALVRSILMNTVIVLVQALENKQPQSFKLNLMDIQLAIERRKRLQILTLAPIVTLLIRYQNYGLIWLEIFMTYAVNSSI